VASVEKIDRHGKGVFSEFVSKKGTAPAIGSTDGPYVADLRHIREGVT
jgi:hypothetical protein